jgi:hypothetical protein
MSKQLFLLLTALIGLSGYAATISGTITQKSGTVLPYSSILVKGTAQGVSANNQGKYQLQLAPGEYTLVCQYIGYQTIEKKLTVGKADQTIDFQLEPQQYDLKEVLVKSGGEDPAYAIIRKAIEKRETHLKQLRSFQCEVYLKGQLQTRDYPDRLLGKKVDFQDGDTSKRKMIFLSESVAKFSVQEGGKQKVEVISSRVSGRSNSFGFSDPSIISLYENMIDMGDELNPRGFISPIADNALNFYRYKFEGSFFENGKEISRIRIIPKRNYEPVFSGHITIVEDEWRIQSADLLLLKKQQMQLLDTVKLQQLFVPLQQNWVIKNQVIYLSGGILGFNFFGSFVQVYDKFDLNPVFAKKYFDHTIFKFLDSANKKPKAYWDSIRPVPLLVEEVKDYHKKDSLETLRQDPHYQDSLDRKRNKFQPLGLIVGGQSFSFTRSKQYFSYKSFLSTLGYNTVEGGEMSFLATYSKRWEGRRALVLRPELRYGFANTHFNPSLSGNYVFGKKYVKNFSFAGGSKVFQFNNDNPISESLNTLTTLLRKSNYMKIYEAAFFRLGYSTGLGNGINASVGFQFQDRKPLNNLADMVSWKQFPEKAFTPNYPVGLDTGNIVPHQSSALTIGITWRPGANYIELPDAKFSVGSKYPVISASITKGIKGLFGSDVDYTRWRLNISDDLNLKLAGLLNYNVGIGGFLENKKTFTPDYQHYMGNQTIISTNYRTGFQAMTYYGYSNTASFQATGHVEYHLNGLLSNKIPGFKKLNCFFVVGANGLYVNNNTNYYEFLFGIENILKILRVDFVQGFEHGGGRPGGFRISLPLDDL